MVPAVADGGEEICKCKELIAHSVKTASLLDKHSHETAACSNHSAIVSTMCHFIRECNTNFKNQKKREKSMISCYLNSLFFDITQQNVSKIFFFDFLKFFFYIFCNSKKWPNRNILKISLVQQKDESF